MSLFITVYICIYIYIFIFIYIYIFLQLIKANLNAYMHTFLLGIGTLCKSRNIYSKLYIV